jgi:multicomponent Na+:H+ antiporter subunit D
MANVVALPILLPLASAVFLLALRGEKAQRATVLTAALQVAVAIYLVAKAQAGAILVLRVGGWDPHLGIVWVVDRFSAAMVLLACATSLVTALYLPRSLAPGQDHPFLRPLQQFLLVGVNGAFVTGDLFNLFVFFEILLLSSFVLLFLGARGEALRRAYPYVVVNLVASALFLAGVGAVYGTTGTVNMAELARRASGEVSSAFWAAIVVVLLVFSVKTALAPVFVWLPDAYPQAPIAINALFAGLLTKVGVYTLVRAVPLFLGPTRTPFHDVLVWVSAATMVIGVLGALGRGSIRGILSFHVVSQVGYMTFALGLLTRGAVAAAIFFLIHQVVVKTALFLAGGIAERMGGSGDLQTVRGLARTHPWVAAAYLVPALSLAGLPPSSGFFGKLVLIVAGVREGAWVPTAIAVAVSFVTLASMLKIWNAAFWGPPTPDLDERPARDPGILFATISLSVATLALGVFAGPVHRFCERAAQDLLETGPYVAAVLGPVQESHGATSSRALLQGPVQESHGATSSRALLQGPEGVAP